MLSEQDDPEHGWHGGKFKIRSGLPEDKYDDADVQEIIPHIIKGLSLTINSIVTQQRK